MLLGDEPPLTAHKTMQKASRVACLFLIKGKIALCLFIFILPDLVSQPLSNFYILKARRRFYVPMSHLARANMLHKHVSLLPRDEICHFMGNKIFPSPPTPADAHASAAQIIKLIRRALAAIKGHFLNWLIVRLQLA